MRAAHSRDSSIVSRYAQEMSAMLPTMPPTFLKKLKNLSHLKNISQACMALVIGYTPRQVTAMTDMEMLNADW